MKTSRSFAAPILIGDTVRYRATILEKRPSGSKPDRGVVRVGIELLKQDGSVVQKGEDVFLVERRTGG